MEKAHLSYKEKYINRIIEIESIISCFSADYKHPFYYSGEFHPFWEMVYVTDGSVNVAGDEKIYTLHKGDIIFHKPMEFHRLWSANGDDIHIYIMAFRARGGLTEKLENAAMRLNNAQAESMDNIIDFAHEKFADSKRQYHRTIMAMHANGNGIIQTYTGMFENFLISLIQSQKIDIDTTENAPVSEIFKDIIIELNANIYGQITLEELSSKCNFSVSQIKRIFSMYSDIGIHKYFIKLKIAESIRLLGRGVQISEISSLLAFSNQNYFSYAFKRETGMSPSLYKKNILEII